MARAWYGHIPADVWVAHPVTGQAGALRITDREKGNLKNVRSGPIGGRNLLEVAAVGTPGVWPYMPEDIARLLPTGERYELIVKCPLDNFSVAIA